ncbi:hypothetical protein Tco_1343973 [Tanacetum coccineum]
MTLLLTNSKAVIILLSVSRSLVSIVGPGCLAAAAAELSPTSHPVGVADATSLISTSSALGLRGRIVRAENVVVIEVSVLILAWLLNPQDAQAQECTLVYGSQVHTLENVVPTRTTVGQPPHKDPQMEYSKIVPQSEQTYR